ncbi:MAG: MBL fold metallo-hydrolase [Thermodesulfobacteriota bacterium]
MQARFWGTRGSLPASLNAAAIREKVSFALRKGIQRGLRSEEDVEAFMDNELPFWVRGTFGTNTPCVELRDGKDFLLFDAGSGLRDFGQHAMKEHGPPFSETFHILLSHLHWDHLQGFPFFVPAYVPGCRIVLHGCHPGIDEAFTGQQSPPFFPVTLKELRAKIEFVTLMPGLSYEIAGFRVQAREQHHPGTSYGYRIEKAGRVVVYSTDSEHSGLSERADPPFVDFIRDADLLIFDAQYTFADACTVKEEWGHSNNLIGVEMARRAGVKHLCLYHMEPVSSDRDLEKYLENTRKLATLLSEGPSLKVSVAWDGMVIEIPCLEP